MTKPDREITEILESYDVIRNAHSAAQLAGCDAKAVRRYVALREVGGSDPLLVRTASRPRLIDGFLPTVEELVDVSNARIRADEVHERLVAMGFTGTERTTSPGRSVELPSAPPARTRSSANATGASPAAAGRRKAIVAVDVLHVVMMQR